MPEIFVANAGKARLNRLTKDVWLELESSDLEEITVQMSLPSLRLLMAQLDAQETAGAPPDNKSDDPLPLGGRYWVTALRTSRTKSGVRLTIHLQSSTGQREIPVDLTAADASGLADDILETASKPFP